MFAYLDLLRIHFAIAWPLLFCSGTVLAFATYGGFSWTDLITAAMIGLFGFEAGMVLNDYIDRIYDKKDVEDRMTKYWRPFGTRPIAEGLIHAQHALILFAFLTVLALILTFTLPFPHSFFVALIMAYSYTVELFYQVKKRSQAFPIAQLVGRTDLALFPVAGYLTVGMPDMTALLYFLFFYPFAIAHLAANDLADLKNDLARGMKTIPVLYGEQMTIVWVVVFTGIHGIIAVFFAGMLNFVGQAAVIFGFLLLVTANIILLRKRTPEAGIQALPLFHIAMLVYAVGILLAFFI